MTFSFRRTSSSLLLLLAVLHHAKARYTTLSYENSDIPDDANDHFEVPFKAVTWPTYESKDFAQKSFNWDYKRLTTVDTSHLEEILRNIPTSNGKEFGQLPTSNRDGNKELPAFNWDNYRTPPTNKWDENRKKLYETERKIANINWNDIPRYNPDDFKIPHYNPDDFKIPTINPDVFKNWTPSTFGEEKTTLEIILHNMKIVGAFVCLGVAIKVLVVRCKNRKNAAPPDSGEQLEQPPGNEESDESKAQANKV